MIIEHAAHLAQKTIILASQSPRRREILTLMGLPFEVVTSNFDESSMDKAKFASPQDYVLANATGKAREVAHRLAASAPAAPPDLVIGSDTVVVLDGRILEKPKSEAEALLMLRSLSGRNHAVVTGVALVAKGAKDPIAFFEQTEVWFTELTDAQIMAYIRSGEPMDKAGSYGIQGLGGSFVQKIDGKCALIPAPPR